MADGALNAAVTKIGNPDTAIWTLIILAIRQFGSSMLIPLHEFTGTTDPTGPFL